MTQKCEQCGKRLSKVDVEKNKGAEKVLCSGCAKSDNLASINLDAIMTNAKYIVDKYELKG